VGGYLILKNETKTHPFPYRNFSCSVAPIKPCLEKKRKTVFPDLRARLRVDRNQHTDRGKMDCHFLNIGVPISEGAIALLMNCRFHGFVFTFRTQKSLFLPIFKTVFEKKWFDSIFFSCFNRRQINALNPITMNFTRKFLNIC